MKPRKKEEAVPIPSDLTRYPGHIPEWLWQDQRRSARVTPTLRKELEADLKVLAALAPLDDQTAYEKKHKAIRKKLNSTFTLRDLTADGYIITHPDARLVLAVQIDPTFDAVATATIRKAADLFVKVAVDPAVVRDAMDTSTDRPEPMPAQFEMKDGKPVKDEFGNQVYTDDYKYFLGDRYRPRDSRAFIAQISAALSTNVGDPALLIISSYTGGKWWGSGRIGYSVLPGYQLTGEVPTSPYLYIALRSDRLKATEPDGADPAFWAGKIAIEVLLNLGYNQPAYKDAADRDANNLGDKKAFVVAYERAVAARARNLLKK